MTYVGADWEDGAMAEIPALDAAAALWSTPPGERGDRPLLVLLHGYGADERDLFGLVPYLPPEYVVAAVRAPLTPPFPAPGFSWYPIEGLDGRDPSHVTDAAALVLDWLEVVAAGAVVGLLGFSQGAAVALQAMRLQPERFAFAVNLSGYVTPGSLPGDSALAERRPPVFWGRGTRDDVIPPFLVEHTAAWLPDHVDLSGRVYPGLTHSVSEQELDDVRVFLEKQLEAAD
jgi:phospholipase/carboxylesterase